MRLSSRFLITFIGILILSVFLVSAASSSVAWNMTELRTAPSYQETTVVLPLKDQSWGYAGIVNTPELRAIDQTNNNVKAIFYNGPIYQGRQTRVFAWVGVPAHAAGTTVPGIVLVHGGGGTAYESWVRLWNARGYAAIAMDTVGAIPTVGKDALGIPGNCGDFSESGNPITDQWTYQAVSCVILANSLLRSLPDVDSNRVGITGVSWGGFLTCISASVDDRFKVAIPIYGCGYLLEASAWIDRIKEQGTKGTDWCKLWDPSVYLPKAKMPFYWLAGTNDAAYWMRGLDKSYRLIKGKRSLSILGNMPHAHGGPGEAPLEIAAIADYYLNSGAGLPSFSNQKITKGTISVDYSYSGHVKAFLLYYTLDKNISPTSVWNTMPITSYTASRVQIALPKDTTMAFVNLFTDSGLQFSSDIFQPAVATWDLATDFNSVTNAGVWNYYGLDGSVQTPLRVSDTSGNTFNSFYGSSALSGWIGYDYGVLGWIVKNTGTTDYVFTQLQNAIVQPGDVISHSDATHSGAYSLFFEWTSPIDDYVNISGSIKMINSGTNKWALTKGNTILASGVVSGAAGADPLAPISYGNLTVAQGDTVALWIGSNPWGANLSKNSLTISTSSITPRITGKVTFADQADSPQDIGLNIDLMQGSEIVQSASLFTDAVGNYQVLNVNRGTYDILFRAHGWLRKLVRQVVVGADGAIVNAALALNGDVDGDNEITSTDLSILGLRLGVSGD